MKVWLHKFYTKVCVTEDNPNATYVIAYAEFPMFVLNECDEDDQVKSTQAFYLAEAEGGAKKNTSACRSTEIGEDIYVTGMEQN